MELFQLVNWLLGTARLDISIPLCVQLIHKIIIVFNFGWDSDNLPDQIPSKDDFASISDHILVRFFLFRHRGLRTFLSHLF